MQHRGLLSIAALLSVAFVGGIGGWAMWKTGLPHPTESNRDQLLQWMVLRDLSAQPEDVSVALVDRIQAEIGNGIDTSEATELSDSYKNQLNANIDHLEEVWFRTRCQQYEHLPRSNRLTFLTEQIDFLLLWAEMDSDLNKADIPDDQRFEFTKEFFDKVGLWVRKADGELSKQMDQGVQDGTVAWLAAFDLSTEPDDTRRELANRITEQLDTGKELTDISFDLTQPQNTQLQQNVELLLRQWIYDLADHYHALTANGKKKLLEEKVSSITKWKVGSFLAENEVAAKAKSNPMKLFADVEKWVETAPKNKQIKVQRLMNDVKQVLFFKFLGGLLSPK